MLSRKVIPLLSSIFLLLGLLTACGQESGSENNQGNENQSKNITLNVWGMGEEAKSLPKIAKDFESENPNIKVNVQALPWDTAHDKLLTAVASKKGPDVLQMGTTWIPEFAASNALLDLTPYLDQYPEFKEDNFYPGSLKTMKYNNAVVGIPWYIDTRVLYYRTDLLQQVGYNEAPKTWDELKDAANKLAARGSNMYGISIDPKEQSLTFMFARQNGSQLIDENGKPLFNKPEFVEAVQYLSSFYKDGSAPQDLGMDIVQSFRGEGITPMFISGPWMVKLINDQAPELKDKWATAVLPKKQNNMSVLGGSNLSVFQYAENKEAAVKFIAYMSRPETQLKWMELTNSLPSTKEAWKSPVLQDDPLYKVFGQQMENAEPMPMIKQFEEIAQTYLSHFERIYRTEVDVQQEMNTFNNEAEKILNK